MLGLYSSLELNDQVAIYPLVWVARHCMNNTEMLCYYCYY